MGKLDDSLMNRVDNAIAVSFGLNGSTVDSASAHRMCFGAPGGVHII